MAGLLFRLGITKSDLLVEVQRPALVAGAIGQTALKTAKVLHEAKDGVLFVDEAYLLAGKGDKDFGSEAIETLMQDMNKRPGEC